MYIFVRDSGGTIAQGIEKVDQSREEPTTFKNRAVHYLGHSSRRFRVTVLVIYSSYTRPSSCSGPFCDVALTLKPLTTVGARVNSRFAISLLCGQGNPPENLIETDIKVPTVHLQGKCQNLTGPKPPRFFSK